MRRLFCGHVRPAISQSELGARFRRRRDTEALMRAVSAAATMPASSPSRVTARCYNELGNSRYRQRPLIGNSRAPPAGRPAFPPVAVDAPVRFCAKVFRQEDASRSPGRRGCSPARAPRLCCAGMHGPGFRPLFVLTAPGRSFVVDMSGCGRRDDKLYKFSSAVPRSRVPCRGRGGHSPLAAARSP